MEATPDSHVGWLWYSIYDRKINRVSLKSHYSVQGARNASLHFRCVDASQNYGVGSLADYVFRTNYFCRIVNLEKLTNKFEFQLKTI